MWEPARHYPNPPGVAKARRLLKELAEEKPDCAPRQVDRPLILYGAGNLGEMAKAFFGRLEIPFLYVVDANADRFQESKTWQGIVLKKPAEVPEEDRFRCLLAICISTAPYSSITAPLKEMGWRDLVPFYDIAEAYIDQCPLSNGWFAGALSAEDLREIDFTLANWHDDISRAHHLQFLAWHTLRKELIFNGAPVTKDDRFFIPQVLSAFNENEIFLDGGAHHGLVSQRFLDQVHHHFRQIYAVEPDRDNLQELHTRLDNGKGAASPDIHILECALGKESGNSPFFQGLDYASQFSPLARESVPVRTLDELDIPATIIKLHLEGWEYDALAGAMQTLKKYRPVLMVTTYHKRNGLWQLPVLLMRNLQDYLFLLRLHGWLGTGCVMYAIPRERYRDGFSR